MPLTLMLSFTRYGMPSRALIGKLVARRASDAAASSNTAGLMTGIAHNLMPLESYVLMQWRYRATRSTLVVEPDDSACRKSAMLASTMLRVAVVEEVFVSQVSLQL